MKKVFIDTNVWIRHLVHDNEQYNDCLQLFEIVEQGKIAPYISNIVVLEITYVLISVYNIPKQQALQDIHDILQTRGLVVIEKTNTTKALSLAKTTRVKISDCFIASQIPENMTLCTYDQDFKKFPQLQIATPKEILKTSDK